MTRNLIHALLSPASYPHPTEDIRLIETHISWVLLTGEFVYKIKKPVDFGFLDFSTLGKRKHFCEEEVRLNSRFSTGLYLGVVAISGSEHRPVVGGTGESEGEVLDYAVKMRQFDQNGLLDRLAAENALDVDDMKSLAGKLAEFHRREAARPAADQRDLGTAESIARATLENFEQISPRLTTDEARRALEGVQAWSTQQLAALASVFAQRHAQGFVRECHGDLHLRNIARIDGEITFFDCIEFSPQLRWIDVQSELAFLLMDMEKKRLHALGNRLLNTYLEYSGDYQGLAVLQFYKVYRAMVRAKVTVLGVDDAARSSADERDAWQEYEAYVRLAQSCCRPRQRFMGLMHGVSGTGKSTVAATLAGESGAIRIRSDVERKRLFGLSRDASSGNERKAQMYGEAASQQTFDVLLALAERLLGLGYPVIVDATFIAGKWRRPFMQLASALEVPLVIIDCQASQETIRQRLALRQSRQNAVSEAGIDVMRSQLDAVEPFTDGEQAHVLAIDTERPVAFEALQNHLKSISGSRLVPQ